MSKSAVEVVASAIVLV